jgi:tripartite-type tricarboxylate transporter receptor subunit TctC
MVAWYAFLAPEGTPPAVVQKVSAAVSKITSSPEYAASLVRMGLDPMPDNARGMADKLPAENERWQKIVLLTKAKVD